MKYKAVLIGCGRISSKHIEAFMDNQQTVELVAVCDIIKERAEEEAFRYGTKVLIYADHLKMLNDIKPDIVSIATESGHHAGLAIDALRAGAHIIVEKPLALSSVDADRIIALARKTGKKVTVCFQNRFNPPIRRTYQAVKDGRFGKILNGMVQVRWNRNDTYYKEAAWRGTWEHDGGTLMNQCIHGIDLLQWMMGGDVVRVHGVTRRFLKPIEAEDFGGAILEFGSGAVGMVEGSANVFPKNLNETLSLFGEKGTVVVGGLAVNKIETWRFSDSAGVGDTEDKVVDPAAVDPPSVYGFGHSALFADFVEAVTNGRDPLVSGEEGKKALDIILAIYKSMKEGGPVDMPVAFDASEMKGVFK